MDLEGKILFRRRRIVIALIAGGVLAVALLGWILPVLTKDMGARYTLHNFLETCPANELRIVRFGGSDSPIDNIKIVVDLDKGKLDLIQEPGVPFDGFNAWANPFVMLKSPPAIYGQGQLAEIKRAVSKLRLVEAASGSYRGQVHVAFWRSGQLCIYHYPVKFNETTLPELERALEISYL